MSNPRPPSRYFTPEDVQRAVDAFPPLTQEQLARVAAVLGLIVPSAAASAPPSPRRRERNSSGSTAPAERSTSSEYLTTQEVADRFRTTTRTVEHWRQRRTGPRGVRIGRRVLYKLAEVEAWEQQRIEGDPSWSP